MWIGTGDSGAALLGGFGIELALEMKLVDESCSAKSSRTWSRPDLSAGGHPSSASVCRTPRLLLQRTSSSAHSNARASLSKARTWRSVGWVAFDSASPSPTRLCWRTSRCRSGSVCVRLCAAFCCGERRTRLRCSLYLLVRLDEARLRERGGNSKGNGNPKKDIRSAAGCAAIGWRTSWNTQYVSSVGR